MRILAILLFWNIAGLVYGQSPPAPKAARGNASDGPAAAKNLKLLVNDPALMEVMRGFGAALGVQCNYCHAAQDFAADSNPHKETARKMIAMVRQIDAFFPSSDGAFPKGYHEVDCITCHRGSAKPETKAAEVFYNRPEWAGRPVPDGSELGKALKVLPPDTKVHGNGSVMSEFRDALNVDCGFCHKGNAWVSDENPRKDVARKMILMLRQINSAFPGTGVYPVGTQAVTCYTCHRGDTHPVAASNQRYPAPPAH